LQDRIRKLNERPFRVDAKYVLYWAQMNRRVDSNHALAFAVELANQSDLPVLFYEGLTCSYPLANDRLHTFLLEGIPDTERRLRELGIGYVSYIRRTRADANDVLYDLAKDAAAVITDDYPTFVASRHNASVPSKLAVACYAVDSSCIVPMSRIEHRQYAAYAMRPKIHKLLPKYLKAAPPVRVARKFPRQAHRLHTCVLPASIPGLVASCEIDHSVKPSLAFHGGFRAAQRRLEYFLEHNLARYAQDKNEPSAHASSNLSPYLHFGHISSLEVALAATQYAKEHKLIAAEFLEELIVRRELAFNFARHAAPFDSLAALPAWAHVTLAKHDRDPRPYTYSRDQLERGETHDLLWNAAQRELLLRGTIHGYYRMYWGKKIIEWTPTHQEALETMIDFHDRYALDGRDPNTYANVLWCFGLHDRPFVERPVFGQVRYMSYDGMRRKTDTGAYIQEIDRLERGGADPLWMG
jgi:deoxyribodipyrimidine photo-lyase